jgi:cellulose biosynthesis protein BcsQ
MVLLPGHIGLAEYEVTLGIAQELSGSLVTLQNLPGAMRYLFDLTAAKYKADYILVDMSPSLGAINQNLLMTSDFFIVPMAPDYFSVMAIDSLSTVLPKWAAWSANAKLNPVLRNAAYPYPEKTPCFLGTIIQKYRPRAGRPSAAFQPWIDKINTRVNTKLVPKLRASRMLLANSAYRSAGCLLTEALLQMPDFLRYPTLNLTRVASS